MPLSREEFLKLHRQGLSPSAIARLDAAQQFANMDSVLAAAKAAIPVETGYGAPTPAAIGRRLATALPDVLGGLGGMAPGPLGFGLAPAGGAVGEAGRELIQGEPLSLGRIAGSAATQEAAQAAGGLLGKAVGAVGGPLMRRALRVKGLTSATNLSPTALKRAAETALEHRIPVGTTPIRGRDLLGSEKVMAAARTSGGRLKRILQQADAAGVQFSPDNLLQPMVELIRDLKRTHPNAVREVEKVRDYIDDFRASHPGPLTPSDVKRLKQGAWSLAKKAIGKFELPEVALKQRLDKALAKGAQKALREIPEQGLGRQIAAQEAHTSRLLQLHPVVQRAEGATSGVTFSPFGPLRPLGTMTPNMRLTRPMVSQLALGATNPAVQGALRQSPRLLDQLYQQLLMEEGNQP